MGVLRGKYAGDEISLYIIGVTSLEFKHHSQPEIDEYFVSVLQSYPDLTRLNSIGQTVEGIL